MAGGEVQVYCAQEGGTSWTLVSMIAKDEIAHMARGAVGTIGDTATWERGNVRKLSNEDINALKTFSSLTNPFKFYCSESASQDGQTRHTQYFAKACDFDGGQPLGTSAGSDGYSSACYSSCPDENAVECASGYVDDNDCGLGGHANAGTFASYGWHYCRESGAPANVDYATADKSGMSNTRLGCGHNDATNGYGYLWIGHRPGDSPGR